MSTVTWPRRGILQNPFGDREAVEARHVTVQQHDVVGVVLEGRFSERLECALSALRGRGPHAPAVNHLAQDEAVRGVVVDDQHPKSGQCRLIDRLRDADCLD